MLPSGKIDNVHYGKAGAVAGKQRRSRQDRRRAEPCGNLAEGSIRGWPAARRPARGLAEVVALAVWWITR